MIIGHIYLLAALWPCGQFHEILKSILTWTDTVDISVIEASCKNVVARIVINVGDHKDNLIVLF